MHSRTYVRMKSVNGWYNLCIDLIVDIEGHFYNFILELPQETNDFFEVFRQAS